MAISGGNRPGLDNFDKTETGAISSQVMDRPLPDNWPWPVIEDNVGGGSGSGGSGDTGDFANSKIGNGLKKDRGVVSVDGDNLLSDVNSRLNDVEGRVDTVEGRLDKTEQDLASVKQDVTNVQQNVTNVENNVTNLQQTIENVQNSVENISSNALDEGDLILYDKDGKIASKIAFKYDLSTGSLKLIGRDGSSVIGEVTIQSANSILEDSKVVKGSSEDYPEGEAGRTYIKFVFRLSSGGTSINYLDATDFIDIYLSGDGINVDDERKISVKLALSKSYLAFDDTNKGLKVSSDLLFENYMGDGLTKGQDGKYKVTLTSKDLEGIGGDFINATTGNYLSKNGSQIDVDKDGILSEVKNRIEDVDSKATQASSDAASAKSAAEEAKDIAEEAKSIAGGTVSGGVYTEGPGIAIDGNTKEISTRLKEKGGILVGEDGAMYIDPEYAKPGYDYESGPALDYLIPFPKSIGDLNVTETDYRVPVSSINDHVTMTVDNLTIGVGRTLTPESACSGLFIRVLGNLVVHGTISMTARGANVTGKNIYIDKSTKKIYAHVANLTELLPEGDYTTISARGGVGKVNSSSPGVNGACGSGGGGGSAAGGTGTSFSGGSGAGGDCYSTGNVHYSGYAPTGNVGKGGAGAWAGVETPVSLGGGGAGNPGGVARDGGAVNTGATGTGGLLVIIVDGDIVISSTGSVVSNGSAGGAAGSYAYSLAAYGGGGSGGGAIHIFFSGRFSDDSKARVRAIGGAGGAGAGGSAAASRVGVAGGNGTVSFVNISSSGFIPGGGSPTLKSGGGIKISKEETEEEDTNTFIISTKLGRDGGLRINDNDELEFDSVLLPMAFDSVYTESGDPVAIGVWKDSDGNKHNVYRRYIEFTVPSTEDDKVSVVSTEDWDIDKVIRIYGYLKHSDGRYLPFDFVGESNRITIFYSPETEQIALIQSGLGDSPAYGFVEYTTKADIPVKMPMPIATVSRSDDWTLNEKYVGTWHDGKPLFRKGFKVDITAANTSFSGFIVPNGSVNGEVVFGEAFVYDAYGFCRPNTYTGTLSSVNNEIRYGYHKAGGVEAYGKLPDCVGGYFLIFVYYTKDIPAPTNIDQYHVHSTEEKIVGEWHDGRLIYERTFTGTTPASGSDLGLVSNVYSVIKACGWSMNATGLRLPIPFTTVTYVYANGNTGVAALRIENSSYAGRLFEVSVQYTKINEVGASTLDLPVGIVEVEAPTVELPKGDSITFIPNFEPTGEAE